MDEFQIWKQVGENDTANQTIVGQKKAFYPVNRHISDHDTIPLNPKRFFRAHSLWNY